MSILQSSFFVQLQKIAVLVFIWLFACTLQAAPKQGGELVVPIITPAFIENFNPLTNVEYVKGLMYEPLVVYNTFAKEIDYRLAESFAYAEDLKSITYTLRKNLKWSDGKPITADDVLYSFQVAADNPAFDVGGLYTSKKIDHVEKIDARTFKIVLTGVDTTAEWFVPKYFILPKHVFSKAKDLKTFANLNPVGSGPITQVEYVKPQQMKICRNPHYYLAGKPYLDCVVYRSFSDNSQIQPALLNNEIDWGSNFIADIEKTYVKADPENNGFWYPANDPIHIYLNTKKRPFNNLKFRQAFSMAIDREAIVDLAGYGYTTINTFPGGIGDHFAESIDETVAKKFSHLTTYDPEAAKKILDEAGYVDKDGDGFRDNLDGSPIDFGIQVVNGWTDWVQTVQMVVEFLADIGVKARVEAVDWGVYDGNLKQAKYEAAINWSLLAVDPIQTYNEYFHTSRIGQSWHASHGVHLRELDKLIEEYGKILDAKRKKEILARLQTITSEQLPFISLFSNATWFQYNKSRVDGWPTAEDPYVHPVWYDEGKRVILFNRLYSKKAQ